jgi:spore maturation protein CgeB
MCKGFTYWITTYPHMVDEFKKIGYNNIICSQWAANSHYLHGDPEADRPIDILFVGQKYGNREQVLYDVIETFPDRRIELYGSGWETGMLEFPEMCEKMRQAKIIINFCEGARGLPQIKLRLFEAMACGSFVLQEYF